MSPNSKDPQPPDPDLHNQPDKILQNLVRYNTTNPPGNERDCIKWISSLLEIHEIEYEIYSKDPNRPNLVSRIKGGNKPGLLLYGHADVVTTQGQNWKHPPFTGEIHDGVIWGRGTLDMKGALSMFISSFIKTAISDSKPAGDLVLCILSDEEDGGDFGAGYMVEQHSSVFSGIDYAIGELGGFSTNIGGERFYPIQVSEKQVCWIEATFHGEAGHASMARKGGVMADMAEFVNAVSENRLPLHVTPVVEEMINSIADEINEPLKSKFKQLTNQKDLDSILNEVDNFSGILDSVLHNTANPTIVKGGNKANVFPSEVTVTLDCRILPGQDKRDLLNEIRNLTPSDLRCDFDILRYEPYPEDVDQSLMPLLSSIIEEADPVGTAFPFLLPAFTDARQLIKLGIQSYGFTPMKLPEEFNYMELVHASNERVPVESIEFGADRIYSVIQNY